jgi:hypothetical protein
MQAACHILRDERLFQAWPCFFLPEPRSERHRTQNSRTRHTRPRTAAGWPVVALMLWRETCWI